jgi:hypothetical protein
MCLAQGKGRGHEHSARISALAAGYDHLLHPYVSAPIVLDPAWSTARAYRVFGLPTSYLIDQRGNIAVRKVGGRRT